jgi:hypothetical protein
MSTLTFGTPEPPKIHDPLVFTGTLLFGLILLLGITFAVDKLGTAMYHRGFAKPFYIKGRRIHHSVIYSILPICYGAICLLFFLGYIHFFWQDFFVRIGDAALVCVGCIAVDIIGDRFWPKIRKNVILHHEWIYAAIPAFIFTFVMHIAI